MQMSGKQIIKLAEFCGWYRTEEDGGIVGLYDQWHKPGGSKTPSTVHNTPQKFKPHTDANDCEALIRALRTEAVYVYIGGNTAGWFVEMRDRRERARPETITWSGDDYKQGVCELALKVIDKDKQRIPQVQELAVEGEDND